MAPRRHARQLAELGFTDVGRRSLGRRMWWGGNSVDHSNPEKPYRR
jgi:hypothetical protein